MCGSYSEIKKGISLSDKKRSKTQKWEGYGFLLFLLLFFAAIWIPHLSYESQISRLNDRTVYLDVFRRQPLGEDELSVLAGIDSPGEILGLYWLENDFGNEDAVLDAEGLSKREERWAVRPGWSRYISACRAIWDDLEYFPVAESTDRPELDVAFEDSWMYDRSYGGERGHEGTDLMPAVNRRGVYPVVSMTDGIVKSKGWLELGGYRLGIEAPGGAYFYYAHLDSYADIEEGDEVKAGDLLGYMGDTGYSRKEGTTGNFPVHLHLGIYIYPDGNEISVNPYPALRYVEERRIRANFG